MEMIRISGMKLTLVFAAFTCALPILPGTAQPQVTQIVDEEGTVGLYSALVVDSNGDPHISYYDQGNGNLKYATRVDEFLWNIDVVDEAGDVGQYTAIALDANEIPHISYYDVTNRALKYATKVGDQWVAETVEAPVGVRNVGLYTSIVIHPNLVLPYISYYDATPGDEGLKLAYKDQVGGSWIISRCCDARILGSGTSVVLDPTYADPIVAYADANANILRLAVFDRGGTFSSPPFWSDDWGREDLLALPFGAEAVSMALDTGSEPHIAYIELTGTAAQLMYVEKRCLGSACLTQVTATQNAGEGPPAEPETVASSGVVSDFASLALDSGNLPHIAFHDFGTGLRYATKAADGSWSVSDIDTEGTVGEYNSMAISPESGPTISYFDATNGDLKLWGPRNRCFPFWGNRWVRWFPAIRWICWIRVEFLLTIAIAAAAAGSWWAYRRWSH